MLKNLVAIIKEMENIEPTNDVESDNIDSNEPVDTGEDPSTTVMEMAIASAPGVKLSRIKPKEDDEYANWDLSGIHNITVDGEHAGTISKQGGGWGARSKHTYIIRPNIEGVLERGTWLNHTPENVETYVKAHGAEPDRKWNNGTTETFYSPKYLKSDQEFSNHNTHTKQFPDQQSAVDYLARAHRLSKEFPGPTGQQDRWNAAVDTKESYLAAKPTVEKSQSVMRDISSALYEARRKFPEHKDLHEILDKAMDHPAFIGHDILDEHKKRFNDLTYDLPDAPRVWDNSTPDNHKHLRNINEPWTI